MTDMERRPWDAPEIPFLSECWTGLTPISDSKDERREHVRRWIYAQGVSMHRFNDTSMTYTEAFTEAYGERLDRRSVPR